MTIEIFGEGCSKCGVMKENVQQAIRELGLSTVLHLTMDPERIAELRVLYLPQLAIDGNIIPSSVWSSVENLKRLLRASTDSEISVNMLVGMQK
ncbi:MAG TPA: thioredoxin family protein [Desulfuromonadales bacterium]|nr:thioredoxin family protein [Desulfuromonadales bacterium]